MNEQSFKWHQLSRDETVKQLKTNASCGLDRKEARLRAKRSAGNLIFTPRKESGRLTRQILSDPAWWLLTVVSLLAITASDFFHGISAFAVSLIFLILLLSLSFHVCKYEHWLGRAKIPKTSVLREGEMKTVSAEELVQGDIVCLKTGDIVPADCRLLSSSNLKVRFAYRLSPSDKPVSKTVEKNAAKTYSFGEEVFAPDYVNIVYAGSEILCGSAKAAVTGIGGRTFIGSLSDQDRRRSKNSILSETLLPFYRLFSFVIWCLVIPVSIIALIVSPETQSTIRIFLPMCALLAACSGLIPSIAADFIYYRSAVSSARKTEGSFLIQSEKGRDLLSQMTDLIVLGNAGTGDGIQHFQGGTNGTEDFSGQAKNAAVLQPLCEAMLLRQIAKESNSPDFLALSDKTVTVEELIGISGYDVRALDLRLKKVEYTTVGEKTILKVTTNEESFNLIFQNGVPTFPACSFVNSPDGRTVVLMPEEMRSHIRRFSVSMLRKGASLTTVWKEKGSQTVFMGTAAENQIFLSNLPDVIKELNGDGIRVHFFRKNQHPYDLLYPKFCGFDERSLTRKVPFHPETPYSFHTGYSQKEIAEFASDLKKEHRTVGLLSDAICEPILSRSVSLRFSSTAQLSGHQKQAGNNASGQAVNRQASDVLVPSVSFEDGGLASVLSGVRTFRTTAVRVIALMQSLISLQLIQVLFFCFSAVFGFGPIAPFHFLYASVGMDLLACILILFSRAEPHSAVQNPVQKSGLRKFYFPQKRILPLLLSVCIFFGFLLIMRAASVFSAEQCRSVLPLSMIFLQSAALLFQPPESVSLPSRGRTAVCLLLYYIPPVLLAVLAALTEPFAAVVDLMGLNFAAFVSLLLAPVLYLVSCLISFRKIK